MFPVLLPFVPFELALSYLSSLSASLEWLWDLWLSSEFAGWTPGSWPCSVQFVSLCPGSEPSMRTARPSLVKIGQHTKHLSAGERLQVASAMSFAKPAPMVTNSYVFHAAFPTCPPNLHAFAAVLSAALSVKEQNNKKKIYAMCLTDICWVPTGYQRDRELETSMFKGTKHKTKIPHWTKHVQWFTHQICSLFRDGHVDSWVWISVD